MVAANTAAPVFLDEYTTSGTFVRSLAMPTVPNGQNHRLTLNSSTVEGLISRSADGRYLVLVGYDAAVGTTPLTATTSAAVNRVIALIDANRQVNSTTALTDAFSGGNPRSACSLDGVKLWAAGGGSSASFAGVRYATVGATTSTQLSTAPTTTRVPAIFNNQMFVSAASGAFQGPSSVGVGLSEIAGNTSTLLAGFPTSSGPSPYDYYFADANTLYVADDRAAGSGGGIQKWTQGGNPLTWTLVYTLKTNLTAGIRSICGTKDAVGKNILYATSADTLPKLVTCSDNGSDASSPFTTLATSATNTAFRGVELSNFSAPNQPPTLDPIPNQAGNELTAITFTATGHDPENGALTYSLTGTVPAGATINSSTGAFSWTPTEAQGPNVYTFNVRTTDPGGLFAEQSVQITVNEVNVAPTLSLSGNTFTIDENTPLTGLQGSATDPDIPANTLTFSLSGAPSGMTINAATGVVSWTPTEAQGGNPNTVYNFSVVVTDNGTPNLSDSKPVSVTVREVNQAPTLSGVPAAAAIDEMAPYTFTTVGSDADLPAQNLTFSISGGTLPPGATFNVATGVFSWTPSEAQGPGVYNFTVRVTDNGPGNLFAQQACQITVREVNRAPSLAAIPNQSGNEGTLITFTASATDPDDPPNVITYSLSGNVPAGASMNGTSGVFSWTPSEAQGPNSYDFNVVATDNGSPVLSDTKSVHIDVSEVNQAPTLDQISDQTVDELVPIHLTAVAHDPDIPAQTLTYSFENAPAGATIDGQTGAIDWTPTEAQGPGNHVLSVIATDSAGLRSDPMRFHVQVNEVNTAPRLSLPTNNASIYEMEPYTFTATAVDDDLPANTLAFSLDGAPAGASIDPQTGAFSWTPTEEQGRGITPLAWWSPTTAAPRKVTRSKFISRYLSGTAHPPSTRSPILR